MDPYPDEEDIEDMRLGNERECLWRMVFQDNDGGVGNKKGILHTKRWDVYMNNKKAIIKLDYYVEVSGSYENKVL